MNFAKVNSDIIFCFPYSKDTSIGKLLGLHFYTAMTKVFNYLKTKII